MNPPIPLSEHPNPYFERESYLSLNGFWDFEINADPGLPAGYSRQILVPFAVESSLSGIKKSVGKGDYLHYRRVFSLPKKMKGETVLLHFEAVDQIADVYLNGEKIAHHEGGYAPFAVELPNLQEENELCVCVQDDVDDPRFPRGKQRKKRGGIWYTPTSGIYQSVWLESMPRDHLVSARFSCDFAHKSLHASLVTAGQPQKGCLYVSFQGSVVAKAPFAEEREIDVDLAKAFHPWSPDHPNLYGIEIHYGQDEVNSFYGLREFAKIEHHGHMVFALNGKPLFLHGLLDQGYYPDGGLTPPSYEVMERDLRSVKELGFNMLRKHIKIEPMRFYASCDKLGIVVMQDMVNGGSAYHLSLIALAPFFSFKINDMKPRNIALLGRKSVEGRKIFERHLSEVTDRLCNVTSLAIYTLFNEGWGQFESARLTTLLRRLDPTRLIDSTSGWYDQGAGDFSSHHIYFRKIRLRSRGTRILSLSEFGGYGWHIPEHAFNQKSFGYKNFRDGAALGRAYQRLYEQEVIPLIEKEGLSLAVYTQLTDVEDEINGLYTYDRGILKIDPNILKAIAKEAKFHD